MRIYWGWVSSENNLFQEGECWMYEETKVFENAVVYGNARLFDDALVFGAARVSGKNIVGGKAKIYC